MLSVVQISTEIGCTHPSTISLLKEFEKNGLIQSKKDKLDERKRMIGLTSKGKMMVKQMQPVWKVMTEALTQLSNSQNNLWLAINEMEDNLATQSFFQRALQHQNNEKL